MRSDIAGGGEDVVQNEPDDRRCAFVIDGAEGDRPARFCGAVPRSGSPYCPEHHVRCRLRGGSAAEQRQLRAIEALAAAAGGKQGRLACEPSALMLQRLDRAARRALARASCSRIVRKGAGDAADG